MLEVLRDPLSGGGEDGQRYGEEEKEEEDQQADK